MKSSDLVDKTAVHRFVSVDDCADIGRHFIRAERQARERLPRDAGMSDNKFLDAVLHFFKSCERLRYAENGTARAHGMNRHRRARHDERTAARHRNRNPDGMSAADDDGSRRLVHAGEHFRNG